MECGLLDGGAVAVRDSKNPTGPALIARRAALTAMVDALAHGRL